MTIRPKLPVSRNAASLLIAVFLLGLAGYAAAVPPAGFEDWWHRILIPFALLTGAFGILENLRMRADLLKLAGALRTMLSRTGQAPTPKVKGEAIEILMNSLRSENPRIRSTAVAQLQHLTGERLGEDASAWEAWWETHRKGYGL